MDNETVLSIIQADITELAVDSIVNAANSSLILGGGVAGAILKKGGQTIQEECVKIGHCNVGDAVITAGGNLKAKYIIHAVGPIYSNDNDNSHLLYNAVLKSLKLAEENKCHSIALPAISTGIFCYPTDQAAKIIIKAVNDFISSSHSYLREIVICLLSESDFLLFRELTEHNH